MLKGLQRCELRSVICQGLMTACTGVCGGLEAGGGMWAHSSQGIGTQE